MSSDVDICNLALSELGDESQVIAISPPDGTIQAAHCAVFYPVVRDAVLQAYPWTFATKRIALSAITNPAPFDWSYAYALPSTLLLPLSALNPGVAATDFNSGEPDATGYPYLVEAAQDGSPVLYTNVATTVLRYIDRVTDTTKFPPLVVLAMSRLLAAYLAGPMLKGETGIKVAQGMEQLFKVEFERAQKADARMSRHARVEYTAPWIRARNGGTLVRDPALVAAGYYDPL